MLLSVLESYFFPDMTKKSSLLVYQVNPMKAAMHLQEILTRITKKYPVLVFRCEHLKEVIVEQSGHVLSDLYVPT